MEEDSGGTMKVNLISIAVGLVVAAAIVGGIIFILKNTDQQNVKTGSSSLSLKL